MAIYTFRTKTYASAVILFGTNRITSIDGYVGIPTEYQMPVKTYIKSTYSESQLKLALDNGWITQSEFDEILSI